MFDVYTQGTWETAPECALSFPEGENLTQAEWEHQFCNLNNYKEVNSLSLSGQMDSVTIYGPWHLARDLDYPYCILFDWLGEGKYILFKHWKDVMEFLNKYCMICLNEAILSMWYLLREQKD